MTFSTRRIFSSATLISSSHTVTVDVTKAWPIASDPSSCSAASASMALLWASVSSRVEASLVITSLRIAAIDFALGEPLPPDFCQQPRCISLVEHDRPRRPAVSECKPVELVQNPGGRDSRKPDHRQYPQMRIAEHR